jgi:threonine/homoserine/homoserine lactone efflux protein
MSSTVLPFLLVSLVLIVTPGPDMALVTRNALRGGWRAASVTSFGVCSGQLLWTTATAVGVAALLAASAFAFTLLKLAGAVYLALLGVRTLLGALTRRGSEQSPAEAVGDQRRGLRHPYWQGVLNNLLNPKSAAIFLSALPQFVAPGDPPLRLLTMGLVFAILTLAWLHLYGGAVALAGKHLGARVRRAFDATAGAVMVGLGVRLAFERR